MQVGTFYVVATPIGNLADLTERAKQVLTSVDVIACEDTRHTAKLLQHLGLRKPLLSVHEHNERERVEQIARHLEQGQSMALVSDAGTPLISDPGYPLVQALRARGLNVSPIPGVSAIITALSAAGLPTDRFTFEVSCRIKAVPNAKNYWLRNRKHAPWCTTNPNTGFSIRWKSWPRFLAQNAKPVLPAN